MKDSRIGSFGALGLILILGLKAACLVGLIAVDPLLAVLALLWSHAASRAAPVWLMHALDYAGDAEHAKAKPLATQAGIATVVLTLVWVLGTGAVLALLVPRLLPALCAAALVVAVTTRLMQRWLKGRLGGYTGDNLGATQQLVELSSLLTLLSLLHG